MSKFRIPEVWNMEHMRLQFLDSVAFCAIVYSQLDCSGYSQHPLMLAQGNFDPSTPLIKAAFYRDCCFSSSSKFSCSYLSQKPFRTRNYRRRNDRQHK